MRPLVLIIALLTLAAAPTGETRADTTGQGGANGQAGLGLAAADYIWEFFYDKDGRWQTLGERDFQLFFSRARCECDTKIRIRLALQSQARAKVNQAMNGTLKLGTGQSVNCTCQGGGGCDPDRCLPLGNTQPLAALARDSVYFETTVGKLFGARLPGAEPCGIREEATIYVLADSDDPETFPDTPVVTTAIQLDGQAPAAPRGVRVTGGNEALTISWDALSVTESADLQGYAVFCARGGEFPPFASGAPGELKPRFSSPHRTAQAVCSAPTASTSSAALTSPLASSSSALFFDAPADGGADAGADGGADAADARPSADGGATDAGDARQAGNTTGAATPYPAGELTVAPQPLRRLDPLFLCTDFLTTSSGVRIRGLENDVDYVVGVAAVDKHGNPSAIETAVRQRPQPSRDFFDAYLAEGGKADGGCTVNGDGPASRDGWVALALAALALAVARKRSRR